MSSLTDQSPAKVGQASNVKIITFTGRRVRDVENTIAHELDGPTGDLAADHLLLDFSNVKHICSVELGTIITLHKRVKASGGRLTLINLSAQVHEVFWVCRLHTFLEICRQETQS